jgi:hypothetical protein
MLIVRHRGIAALDGKGPSSSLHRSPRIRLQPSKQPDEPLKDVTTQLHGLRMEQARERPVSSSITSIHQPAFKSSLGFLPAAYTAAENICDEIQPARRITSPKLPRSWTERRRIDRTAVCDPDAGSLEKRAGATVFVGGCTASQIVGSSLFTCVGDTLNILSIKSSIRTISRNSAFNLSSGG